MTILHAWRCKVPGYEVLQSRIRPSRLVWASPAEYIRKSPLLVIGGVIGEHLDQTIAEKASDTSLTAKFQAVIDDMPTRDDDSDDDSEDDSEDDRYSWM
jgi:hypothetical protein